MAMVQVGSPHACRERNDGLYRVITYLCYKMLEELIVAILISVVVACIVFYGVQLKGQWVTFWLTYLVTLSCGVGEPILYCMVLRLRPWTFNISWQSNQISEG